MSARISRTLFVGFCAVWLLYHVYRLQYVVPPTPTGCAGLTPSDSVSSAPGAGAGAASASASAPTTSTSTSKSKSTHRPELLTPLFPEDALRSVEMKCSAYYLEGWGRPRETPALVHEALWKKTDGKPITGDIYQFGVYTGTSMRQLAKSLYPKLTGQSKMWGFDSFKGLPKEDGSEQYLQKRFYVGAYKAEDTVAATLREELPRTSASADGLKTLQLDFVKGFFNESLTPTLAEQRGMQPAAYIDIDVDLYVSSIQALTWLFESNLVRPGTLLGYDDWWSLQCSKGGRELYPLDLNEGRAHLEISKKYLVEYRCVAGGCRKTTEQNGNCAVLNPLFVVVSIGKKSDHGFEFADKAATKEFAETDPFCVAHAKERMIETLAVGEKAGKAGGQ